MAKRFAFWTLISTCMVLPACVIESKNPISDPAAAKQDFELHGLWVSSDQAGNRTYLHIGAESEKPLSAGSSMPEEGLMTFWLVTHERQSGKLSKPLGMRFFVSHVGDNRYANLVLPVEGDPKPAATTSYWFLKYRVIGTGLETWGMNFKETAKVVESGRLKGEITRDPRKPEEIKSVLITDTPANIEAFLRDSASQALFPDADKSVYTRVP